MNYNIENETDIADIIKSIRQEQQDITQSMDAIIDAMEATMQNTKDRSVQARLGTMGKITF